VATTALNVTASLAKVPAGVNRRVKKLVAFGMEVRS
jgi:hypothetical protein